MRDAHRFLPRSHLIEVHAHPAGAAQQNQRQLGFRCCYHVFSVAVSFEGDSIIIDYCAEDDSVDRPIRPQVVNLGTGIPEAVALVAKVRS